jgi:hypothetical protein
LWRDDSDKKGVTEVSKVKERTASGTRDTITATLTVPMGPHPMGYNPQHVDIVVTAAVARAIGRLFDGLRVTRAMLQNGQPVKSHQDAVRWLLEQLPEPDGQLPKTDGQLPVGG